MHAPAKIEADWGDPPWKIDFIPPSAPVPKEIDVAVIGGGFTGLAAAARLRLSDPAKSVAVFEAGRIGSGASGRTGGMALSESAAGDLPGLGDVLGGVQEIFRVFGIQSELNLPGAREIARKGQPLTNSGSTGTIPGACGPPPKCPAAR